MILKAIKARPVLGIKLVRCLTDEIYRIDNEVIVIFCLFYKRGDSNMELS